MKVSIPIYFKKGDDIFVNVVNFVNPNVATEDLTAFIEKLHSLTDNDFTKVLKVVEEFINKTAPEDEITPEQIHSIIDGSYILAPDDDPITKQQIHSIIDGSYIPVEEV